MIETQPFERLSGIVLEAGSDETAGISLAITHRPGRLPCSWVSDLTALANGAPLRWRCADGRIEELAVAHDHWHRQALWQAINGQGLLVIEIRADGADLNQLEAGLAVGYWTLSRAGGGDWIPAQDGPPGRG